MTTAALLYKQNYLDKDFERLELFDLLQRRYLLRTALYPGSFLHITPSLVYPVTVYADTDERAGRFFSDPWVREFVEKNKRYEQTPVMRFHAQDYTAELPEPAGSFDLLISQWAGFVSQACKSYLKDGGLLLVNNSHGDASMASIDGNFRFIGAVTAGGGRFRLIETNLDSYFVPKSSVEITREYLFEIRRGIGYTKTAWAYLFEFGIDFLKRRQ
jgi:hypothetical protein